MQADLCTLFSPWTFEEVSLANQEFVAAIERMQEQIRASMYGYFRAVEETATRVAMQMDG